MNSLNAWDIWKSWWIYKIIDILKVCCCIRRLDSKFIKYSLLWWQNTKIYRLINVNNIINNKCFKDCEINWWYIKYGFGVFKGIF